MHLGRDDREGFLDKEVVKVGLEFYLLRNGAVGVV